MPGKSLFSVPESATRVLKSERRSLRRIILLCNRRHRESGHHTIRLSNTSTFATVGLPYPSKLDFLVTRKIRPSYTEKYFKLN
jgi:hypothetical protein